MANLRKTNSDGFTILEAVIGMLLASGLAVAVATVMNMSSKSERNASMGAEHAELLGVIRQIITQPASCTANLQGITLDTSVAGKDVDIFFTKTDNATPPITIKDKPILVEKPLPGGTTGKFFGKIQVTKITGSLYAQLSATPNIWLAKISVEGEKTGDVVGGKNIYGSVTTQVEVNGGTVIKCIGDQNLSFALTNNDPVLNQKICFISSNGSKAYDPATNACIDNLNCNAFGNHDTAACPASSIITGCIATGTIIDGSIPPTRNFSNHPQQKLPLTTMLPTINSAAGTCTCDYTTDPLVNSTNAVCTACCQTPL